MVRLTDRPDMTLDVHRGRKKTILQQQLLFGGSRAVRDPRFDSRSGLVSPSADSRGVVVSYWRKYVHEVLVNRLEVRLRSLSLPRKSVVRFTRHDLRCLPWT